MNIIDRIKKRNIDRKLQNNEYVKSLKIIDLEKIIFDGKQLIDYIVEQHLEYVTISKKIEELENSFDIDYDKLNEYKKKMSQIVDVYSILFENEEIVLYLLKSGYIDINNQDIIDLANKDISFALKVVDLVELFPEKFKIYFEKFSQVMNFETFMNFFNKLKNSAENYDEIINFMEPVSINVLEENHFWNYLSLFKAIPQLSQYASNKEFYEKYDKYEKQRHNILMFDCHKELIKCALKLNIDVITLINDINEDRFLKSSYVDSILKEMCVLNISFVKKCLSYLADMVGCDYLSWSKNEEISKFVIPYESLTILKNPEFSQKFQEIFSKGIISSFLQDKKYVDEHLNDYNQRWINYDEETLARTFGSPVNVDYNNGKVRFYTANGQEFKMLVHSIVNSNEVKPNGSSKETQEKIKYLQENLSNNPSLFVDSNLGLENTSISCSTISERDICTFGLELVYPNKDHILIGFNETNQENIYHYGFCDAGLNRDAHLSPDSTIYNLCIPKYKKTGGIISYDEVDISRKNRKPQYILTTFPPQDIENNEKVMKWANYYNIPIIYVDRKAYVNKYRQELKDLLESRDNTKCLSGYEITLYKNILFCMQAYGIADSELSKYNYEKIQFSIFEKYPTYANASVIIKDRIIDENIRFVIGTENEKLYKKIILAYLEVSEDYDNVWNDFKESLFVPRYHGDGRTTFEFYEDWKQNKEGKKNI